MQLPLAASLDKPASDEETKLDAPFLEMSAPNDELADNGSELVQLNLVETPSACPGMNVGWPNGSPLSTYPAQQHLLRDLRDWMILGYGRGQDQIAFAFAQNIAYGQRIDVPIGYLATDALVFLCYDSIRPLWAVAANALKERPAHTSISLLNPTQMNALLLRYQGFLIIPLNPSNTFHSPL